MYHTDFYKRLFVMVSWQYYGVEVPSTPGPTCLKDEIVGLLPCSVTVAQFIHAPPPMAKPCSVHSPRWTLPSGWWSDQTCVSECKLPSHKFPANPGIDVVIHNSSMHGLTHVRFLTVWFHTANPVWPFVLWCYGFHKTISKFITPVEGCRYSELAVHFLYPFRHPSYVWGVCSCGLFSSLRSLSVNDCFLLGFLKCPPWITAVVECLDVFLLVSDVVRVTDDHSVRSMVQCTNDTKTVTNTDTQKGRKQSTWATIPYIAGVSVNSEWVMKVYGQFGISTSFHPTVW